MERGTNYWIRLPQTEKLIDLNLSNKLSLSQKRVLDKTFNLDIAGILNE